GAASPATVSSNSTGTGAGGGASKTSESKPGVSGACASSLGWENVCATGSVGTASTGDAAGASTGSPHCLQNLFPGARSAPHCPQTGAAGPAPSGAGMAWPQPPQKLLPAITSLPHLEQ